MNFSAKSSGVYRILLLGLMPEISYWLAYFLYVIAMRQPLPSVLAAGSSFDSVRAWAIPIALAYLLVARTLQMQRDQNQERRLLRAVFDSIPDIVYLKDKDSVYVEVNQAFAKLVGQEAKTIRGCNDLDFFSAKTAIELRNEDLHVMTHGAWQAIRERKQQNGDIHFFDTHKLPFHDADGKVIGVLGNARDITEQVRMEAERTKLAEELAQSRLDRAQVELKIAADRAAQMMQVLNEGTTLRSSLERREQAVRRENDAANRRLAEQEQFLRLITENLPALIVYVDSNERVTFCNRLAAKLFGRPVEDIIGYQSAEVFSPGAYEFTKPYYQKALLGETVTYIRTLNNGRTIETILLADRAENGHVRGVFGMSLEITEKLKNAEALQNAITDAEKANQAKGEFLAMMSHEIRTPLHAILGLTTLMQGTPLDGQQLNYVTRMNRSAQLLLGLVNDILDFSKIEAGKLALESRTFSLDEVIEKLTDLFSDAAKEKNLLLVVEVSAETPKQLIGDSLRLAQILVNLCSNAIKFTQNGEVLVRIAGMDQGDGRAEIEFSVTDTGIGMAPEKATTVFEAFSQADGSTTRRYGGTGLGLTICRDLVKLMGGQIELYTRLDEGSCFSFRLCFDVPAGPSSATLANYRSHLKGARILHVDDNPMNHEIISAYLSNSECRITHVMNGQEAVQQASIQSFDAILMDCQMPVMDGYQATQILRQNPRLSSLPIIALTANAAEQDREKCLAAGMSDFLSKPVLIDDLLDTLTRHIQGREVRAAGAISAPKFAPPANRSPGNLTENFSPLLGIDLPSALRIAMGNPKLLKRMLRMFYETYLNFETRFKSASLKEGSEVTSRMAHTLKGDAASIGAIRLKQAAFELESACRSFAEESIIPPGDTVPTASGHITTELNAVVAELIPVLDGIAITLSD